MALESQTICEWKRLLQNGRNGGIVMALVECVGLVALILLTYLCVHSLVDRVCRCKEICAAAKTKNDDIVRGCDDES